MSELIVRIHNTETNEIINRDYTEEEIDLHNQEQAIVMEEKDKAEKALEAKQALLAKLGITEEEAKLLLL